MIRSPEIRGESDGVAAKPLDSWPNGGTSLGSRATAGWQAIVRVRDRAPDGSQPRFGQPLEAAVRAGRNAWAAGTPIVWATVPFERSPMVQAPSPAPPRRQSRGIRERALDAAADCARGRAALRRPIPFSLARLCPACPRLESPATTTTGKGAR